MPRQRCPLRRPRRPAGCPACTAPCGINHRQGFSYSAPKAARLPLCASFYLLGDAHNAPSFCNAVPSGFTVIVPPAAGFVALPVNFSQPALALAPRAARAALRAALPAPVGGQAPPPGASLRGAPSAAASGFRFPLPLFYHNPAGMKNPCRFGAFAAFFLCAGVL